ncbi:PAS domain-containing sensor histidine kinase [Caulobacter segnis]|uniref:histidine kinase n=1 Tax=Caulobacter segnis TaxID=88688 RepID=A0A2W5V872_9CAUL|nr:hybrid sensor histidine kinase/response regulator [Caulobacter segnis]PZR34887.1 MAG: hybrid sensor histidine kinase/response regulator [Caulobacter segnis]
MMDVARSEPRSVSAEVSALRALIGPMFDALNDLGVALSVSDPRQADDPIVFVNGAFEGLTGLDARDIVGRNRRCLNAPDTGPEAYAALEAELARKGRVSADVLNARRNGAKFWDRIVVTTIRDADGVEAFRVGTHADVSAEYQDAALGEQLRMTRQRLLEAKERLRITQTVAGAVGAWEWDIANGRLIADARFAELCGLDPVEAAEGMPTSAFFHTVYARDRMRLKIAVAGALHGAEVFARDYRVVLDGDIRWVSARGRTFVDEDDRPVRFAGVLADITEQKKLEERLRIAQTAGGVGSFEYLSGFGTADVSEAFCRLLGLHPASSLPVRTINALVHPDDPPLISARAGAHDIGPSFQEFRIRRADTGEERWLASRGEYQAAPMGGVNFIGVVYDITSAKHDEARLRALSQALEERVEARTQERDRLWNLSRDLVSIAGDDGVYRAINPAWKTLLGYDSADLIGRAIGDLVHADDLERTRMAAQALRAGNAVSDFDCRVRDKGGDYRWINWTAVPEDDAIYLVGRDVSQRKLLEDQLRQSQKMEAVGQLTGGLAHDFNNMLTGILGGIDMVRRRLADGRVGDVERFLDAAMQSGQRAAALTHRLLAFSRRQTLDNRALDVGSLIGSMADLLRRTLGEQVQLSLEVQDELWSALADENQLESAVLNLAINARDAMPHGGHLTVSAHNVELSSAELANSDLAEPGEYVEVRVSDTGLGMTPDVLAKVFDPFFTTKPLGQGTGLGLSMIYGFVQQSKGHVTVESVEGLGTTIRLYLPRHRGDIQQEPVIQHQAQPGAGETVLVIEDDPSVRLLVLQVLEELGYRTVETEGGRDATPILQSGRKIDLMISDVGLPGMNGRQLAEIARESRPDLPVLFMTGYAEQASDQSAFLDPGMQIIVKPFGVDQLAARIEAILKPR